MFSVLECVVYQHDLRFSLIATLVSILGNTSPFVVLTRSMRCIELAGGGAPLQKSAMAFARRMRHNHRDGRMRGINLAGGGLSVRRQVRFRP